MNKILVGLLWMRNGTWNRCPIKILSLTDSLACHLCGDSHLEDMCKFKSSQKHKSRPVGRFLECF